MALGLDIDGVLADSITPFSKLLEARSGGVPIVRKLGIELFVDDRHENCEDVATETDAVVLMPHRPYNQSFSHPKVRRIHELDELWDHFK